MSITLGEMRAAALYEAERIGGSQAALIAAGCRVRADAGELARAAAFEAIAKLIDAVAADRHFVERLAGIK